MKTNTTENPFEKIRETERKITENMVECPCCKSKGECVFVGHDLNGEKYRIGCSDMENCGIFVPNTKAVKETANGQPCVHFVPRTPEEMLEIWNKRGN